MSEGKQTLYFSNFWQCSEVNLGLGVGRGDARRVDLQGNAWFTGHLPFFRCSSIIKLELQGSNNKNSHSGVC